MSKKYLNVQDVAEILGIDRKVVIAMINDGQLPAIKVRTRWKISEDDFNAYIAALEAEHQARLKERNT